MAGMGATFALPFTYYVTGHSGDRVHNKPLPRLEAIPQKEIPIPTQIPLLQKSWNLRFHRDSFYQDGFVLYKVYQNSAILCRNPPRNHKIGYVRIRGTFYIIVEIAK